jgi:hypothetical protein
MHLLLCYKSLEMQKPDGRFYKILGTIFLILLSTTVAIVVCDKVFSWLELDKAQFALVVPINERYPRPYVESAGRPGTHVFNRLGYRDDLPGEAKGNEFRVFVVGGSTVMYGDPPFSKLLEEEFHKAGYADARVFNFGAVSSVSGQDLARIVYDISRFEPDLVILYNGGNDILHGTGWDPRPGYPMSFLLQEKNPLLQLNGGYRHHFLLFLSSIRIFRTALRPLIEDNIVGYHEERKRQLELHLGEEGLRQAFLREYIRHVTLAGKVSKSLGAEFIAVFQPLADFSGAGENLTKDARRIVLEKFAVHQTNSDFRFADLSNLFLERAATVYIDPIHIKQEFQGEVASAIFGELLRPQHSFKFWTRLKKTTANVARTLRAKGAVEQPFKALSPHGLALPAPTRRISISR